MGFPPSLARLLILRQSLERQEELKLAMIANRLLAATRELEAARRGRHQNERSRFDEFENSVGEVFTGASTGSLLHAAGMSRAAALGREQRLADAVAELQTAHRAQCAALAIRTRDRKILETLRDRHRETQRREQLRRLQSSLDEMYLLRHP